VKKDNFIEWRKIKMTEQNEMFQIGHVLIKVQDLKEAVRDYEELGFRVSYGSAPDKATNAMIYFEDGSFLELFCTSFGQPMDSVMKLAVKLMLALKSPYAGRYRNYITPVEGFRDYALDSTKGQEFAYNMELLKQKGITVHGPRGMKRKNTEGILMTWSLCFPPQERLPFFMSPYSPALSLSSAKTEHPNGAVGFKEITITAKNWEEDLAFYQSVYQQNPPLEKENNRLYCRFQIAGTTIVLEKGHMDGIRRILLTRKVSFNHASSTASNSLNLELCHGAELILVSEEGKE
jgi:catechol 2,3-dioxygenase-like lactoylglutathione lyase family enzyme